MLKRIRSWFAWEYVRENAVWSYWQNRITGQRKAFKEFGGYCPIDFSFIRDGDKVVDARGVHIVGRPGCR